MKISTIFVAFALLAVTVYSQTATTCSKGDDGPCKDLVAESCCAYTKTTVGGNSVEVYGCALPSTFDSLKSAADASGADFEIYCANSVFMKLSVAVFAFLALVNFF